MTLFAKVSAMKCDCVREESEKFPKPYALNLYHCCLEILSKFSNENRQIDGDFRNICHSNHFFSVVQAQT